MIKKPLTKNLGIDAGRCDGRTCANHNDRSESEKHSGAKLRDFENVGEGADHLELVAAALGRCLNFGKDNFAPGLLDFLASCCADLINFNSESLGDFTTAEDFDSIETAFNKACFAK